MASGNGNHGAMVAAGCEACAHPARDEIDQQLIHDIDAQAVAQSFGLSPVVVEWHGNKHLRGVARRVPNDPRELLVDLDYARSTALEVAQSAAAEGKRQLQLAALKEYRESTLAICKLVDAKAVLSGGNPQLVALCDELLKLIAKHPDWRGELVAAVEASQKGVRGR